MQQAPVDTHADLTNDIGRVVPGRYDAESVIPLFGLHRRRLHLQRSGRAGRGEAWESSEARASLHGALTVSRYRPHDSLCPRLFQDHFYLVGPPSNPAKLSGSSDSVLDMFNKIVGSGNADAIVRLL